MHNKIRVSLIGIAMLVSFMGIAHAGLIVQNKSFSASASFESHTDLQGPSTVHLNNAVDGNTPFDKFNSELGTLNSIQIDITNILMVGDARTLFTDLGTLPVTSGLSALQDLHLDFLTPSFNASRFVSGAVDRCSAGPTLSEASCWTFLSVFSFSSQLNAHLEGIDFADYIGLGSWTLGISQIGRIFNNETDGDDDFTNYREATLTSSGDIKVTYNFTAAPPPPTEVAEPTTLAILAIALAGLGLRSRLRK